MSTETHNVEPGNPVKEPSSVADVSSSTTQGADTSINESQVVAETASPHLENTHPRQHIPAWKWKVIILGNGFMSLINGYDVSNVANVQIPIYKAFGHIELLPWISLSYSLVNVATIPLARKLTGFCELRILAFCSCVFIFAGSALSGAAPNIESVIVGRALMGIGAAALYQIALSYNVIFAYPHELGLAQAVLGFFFAVGLITGPIIGGAFAENLHATWRWAFYINLPIVAFVPLCLIFYPSYRVPTSKTFVTHVKEIDWVGWALHVGTFLFLGLGCIFSGPTWAWNSGSAIAAWVLFGVFLVTYVSQQGLRLFTTPERQIFPVRALRKRAVALTCLCTMCVAMGYGVTLYYTPVYFAFTRGQGALAAAVRLLPFVCVFIFMIFLAGGMLPAIRYYMPFYVLGGILVLIGAGLQQTITPQTSESSVLGFQAILGAGIGLLWNIAVPVASMKLRPEERFDGAVLLNLAQLGGVAISLSLAGSIYQNVGFRLVKSAVDGFGFSDADVRGLLSGADSPILAVAQREVLALSVEAVTKTIVRCFCITLAAGAVCFLAACCLKFEALDFKNAAGPKEVESETGDVEKVEAKRANVGGH